MRKRKSIFLKISKICFVLFFIAIAIFVYFAIATKDKEITVPIALGIYLLATTFATLVCIVIAWVLDLIENVRAKRFSYFIGYAILILALWAVFMAIDYFIEHITGDWLAGFVKAVISVCAIKAANYIFVRKTK